MVILSKLKQGAKGVLRRVKRASRSAKEVSPLSGKVRAYLDGTLYIDHDAIMQQYSEQFKASARSNLEEQEWQERPDKMK